MLTVFVKARLGAFLIFDQLPCFLYDMRYPDSAVCTKNEEEPNYSRQGCWQTVWQAASAQCGGTCGSRRASRCRSQHRRDRARIQDDSANNYAGQRISKKIASNCRNTLILKA
jgi:hypothetical protein